MYRITFKKSAQKELADIPKPFNLHIVTAIDKLSDNPRPDGVKKLKGEVDAYRIRVGDYRVIYIIEDIIKLLKYSVSVTGKMLTNSSFISQMVLAFAYVFSPQPNLTSCI